MTIKKYTYNIEINLVGMQVVEETLIVHKKNEKWTNNIDIQLRNFWLKTKLNDR